MIVEMLVFGSTLQQMRSHESNQQLQKPLRATLAVQIYPMHVLNIMLICLFKHYEIGRHNNSEHIALHLCRLFVVVVFLSNSLKHFLV